MSIIDADSAYRGALEALAPALDDSRQAMLESGPLPLDGTEISKALILRLGSFYSSQEFIKKSLGKRYIGAGADFFVESVLFYLRAVLETHDLSLEAAGERALRPKKKAMRPDVSVWRGDSCVAIVECKTQLGWSRNDWKIKFAEREVRLFEEWSGAQAFLLVMTNDNWPGFGDDPLVGSKYFVLSERWPSKVAPAELEQNVVTPIEQLFRKIVTLAVSPGRQ